MRNTIMTLCMCSFILCMANDSSYNGNGSLLFPKTETDISVKKEVLTITLTDYGYSIVDVDYTFYNPGKPKTVLMGYETDTYNSGDGISLHGGNPNMHEFENTFNGVELPYTVKPVVEGQNLQDYLTHIESEFGETDFNGNVTYAYSFKAYFPIGESKLHQRFRLSNSISVDCPYMVFYKLTPATRWAGGKIEDFTLRIDCENTAKHFLLIADDSLMKSSWHSPNGQYGLNWKSRIFPYNGAILEEYGCVGKVPEIVVRDASIQVKIKDYTPKSELSIYAISNYYQDNQGNWLPFAYSYDRSGYISGFFEHMTSENQNSEQYKLNQRIIHNLPYASRGYRFKDAQLREYFNSLFWYMPNPSYETDPTEFTDIEKDYVSGKYIQ